MSGQIRARTPSMGDAYVARYVQEKHAWDLIEASQGVKQEPVIVTIHVFRGCGLVWGLGLVSCGSHVHVQKRAPSPSTKPEMIE